MLHCTEVSQQTVALGLGRVKTLFSPSIIEAAA